jgi:phospholipid transport system substrate-binding protein
MDGSMRARAALCFAVFTALSAPAIAATPAEDFIQSDVQKGLTILNDKSASRDEMAAQFRGFLESLTDMRRIALYTLGPAATTGAPGDVDAFVAAFHDYAIAEYQAQLTQYSGESLKVTGSTERAPGDFVVNTVVADAGGHTDVNSAKVDFRVSNTAGRYVVLDASVSGVWLATNEHDQFQSFLAQHNGDLNALTAHLKELTADMRS